MTSTMIRTNWDDVTLVEYEAHRFLGCSDGGRAALEAYWDYTHANNPFADDGQATRLTPEGEAWLSKLSEDYRNTNDERELISLARDFVREFGTLTTMGAARLKKGRG